MFRKSLIITLLCASLAAVSAEDRGLPNPFGSWSEFTDRIFKVVSNTAEDIRKNIFGAVGDVGKTAGNIVNGIATEEGKKAGEVIDNVGELVETVKDGKIIDVPLKALDVFQSLSRNINGIPGDVLAVVIKENINLAMDIASRVKDVGSHTVVEVFSCLSEMFKMVLWNEVISKLSPKDVQKFLKAITGLLFKMSDATEEEGVQKVQRLMDEVLDEFVKDPEHRRVLKNHLQEHFSRILSEKQVPVKKETGNEETTEMPKGGKNAPMNDY